MLDPHVQQSRNPRGIGVAVNKTSGGGRENGAPMAPEFLEQKHDEGAWKKHEFEYAQAPQGRKDMLYPMRSEGVPASRTGFEQHAAAVEWGWEGQEDKHGKLPDLAEEGVDEGGESPVTRDDI